MVHYKYLEQIELLKSLQIGKQQKKEQEKVYIKK